ncbi:MAK10-like protein [Tanacetum coccineum]
MGDENPICTLGDYSRPSHEGYRNTIELPEGNNVVPLRSDTIRERTRLCLFQFSLCDQASNWLERLSAGSISIWEDLTTRFLAQFFPPGRTAKLRNDILMFQQHHGESVSEVWTRFKDLLQKVPHHGIDLWLQVQIFYDHVNPVTRRTIDQSAGGKLRNLNPEESWAILEDLALYDNKSWNDPRDFAKPVKVIALPQDVLRDVGLFTLPCRLGDLEPFDTLADLGSCVNIIPLYLFKKLNIGLLEETDHIFGLADKTKSYPVRIVKDVVVHIGKLKLLNDFYILDMKKDPEIPLLVGKGFLATANAVIDCRMAKIAVGERITRLIFSVKGIDLGGEEAPYWTTLGKRESYKPRPSTDGIGAKPPYYARKDFIDCHLPGEYEISRDVELNPFKDTIVFRRLVEFLRAIPINLKSNMWESEDLIKKPIDYSKPPKNGDGACQNQVNRPRWRGIYQNPSINSYH